MKKTPFANPDVNRTTIGGSQPVFIDLSRAGWFGKKTDQRNPAEDFAGSEGIVFSLRRKGGDDIVVVPEGLRSMVVPIQDFYEAVGLPCSRIIFVGGPLGQIPVGYRYLFGAYNPAYNLDGRFDAWGATSKQATPRDGFTTRCVKNKLGNKLPPTYAYAVKGKPAEPSRQKVKQYFDDCGIWYVKLVFEVLDEHNIHKCTSPEQMFAAIKEMHGRPYVIQRHIDGLSYSLNYEVVMDENGQPVPVFQYAAVEEVVGKLNSQVGAWAHTQHEWVRSIADPLARLFAKDHVEGMLGFGVIADAATGVGFCNDHALRQQGGDPVWRLKRKMELYGAPLTTEHFYRYLKAPCSGEEMLKRILASRFRPNLATGGGLWPVSIKPNGSGRFAAYGPNAKQIVDEAMAELGLTLAY